jgi:hypothetical protein
VDRFIYIYQHVPKCGGTSFRVACLNYFSEIHEVPPPRADTEAWEAYQRNKPDFATLPLNTIITGHLIHDGTRPRERYAAEIARGGVRILTVLRDPLARLVSLHHFAEQNGREMPVSLEERLRRARNPVSRNLGFDGSNAEAFLQGFFLVGLTERLQDTIDLLAHSIGRESIQVPRENAAKKQRQAEVPPDAIERFRENNRMDYELYDTAVAMFTERCRRELGRDA